MIDIEVEVGDSPVFKIMEEIDGFWIEHDLEGYLGGLSKAERDEFKKRFLEGLKWIIDDIKRVVEKLDIHAPHAPHFALDLVFMPFNRDMCCVTNKQRSIVYLRLPMDIVYGNVTIDVHADEYDHLLYHELMHAKDCLEGRFPACGLTRPGNLKLDLLTSLWHFSIEGRLESMGLPHLTREEAINREFVHHENVSRELLKKLCDKTWGREVTFKELESLINSLYQPQKQC